MKSDQLPASDAIAIAPNDMVRVIKAVSILESRSELFAFWRNFENLPRIIKHPVRITALSPIESRWEVTGPPGESHVTWTSTIVNEEKDRSIEWRTDENADVPHSGIIRFQDGPPDEGTEVIVSLDYDPPGGKLGVLFGKLSGKEPGQQVAEALRRFKALMEAGEIPTIEGQSVGGPQAPRKGEK